jgi:ribosomal-protein-alanine N-acetyltransferase
MANDCVHLRPVEERDLAMLERIDKEPALSEPFEWRGFANAAERRHRWERDGYLGDGEGLLVVALLDQTFLGFVVWAPAGGSAHLRGCFRVGILLLPDHRGRGYGSIAQALLAEYLFANTLVNRVEATTEADNIAEQRALEKAGFTREGVLRGRGFLRGSWRDGVMYSRLRGDPLPISTRQGGTT